MRRKNWIISAVLMVECYILFALQMPMQQKADSMVPIPANSPPVGNTTFIERTTWCVARAGAYQGDLQNALDWVCGLGAADCSALQGGGPCFEPDTLLSHASYAFNSYYQQNGNSDGACYFGGTATTINRNPSYGSCVYHSSETASTPSLLHHRSFALKVLGILIIMCINAAL